jgi:hypothetical protein
MKELFIVLFTLFFIKDVVAQKECGTPNARETFYDSSLTKMYSLLQQKGQLSPQTTKFIRVVIIDILSNDGTDSSWNKSEIIDEFQIAKDVFKAYNICLVLIRIDYIQNSSLQNYQSSAGPPSVGTTNTSVLKMYLHNTLALGNSSLNGNAYTIISNTLSLSRGAIGQKSMAHEIGHCFGLLHTFTTSYGLECPDGSNGTTDGDKIADTRATPDNDNYLANSTNASCVYSGNLTIDCNGAVRTYLPEIINMMSYGRRECRSVFSFIQIVLMHSNIESSPVTYVLNIFPTNNAVISNAIVNFDDTFIDHSILTIGNNASNFNTFLGFTAKQKFIAVTQVKITKGVKISPTSNRCKVTIKAAIACMFFYIIILFNHLLFFYKCII